MLYLCFVKDIGISGFDTHDWNVINTRVETLWEEFRKIS